MTFPDKHRYTMPMLVAIHLVMGVATAGVTLASGNIGLKLAPKGEATAYLALLSLVSALAAGIAPIFGGLFADFFAQRELALVVQWFSPEQSANVSRFSILRHWGFFFVLAVVLGLVFDQSPQTSSGNGRGEGARGPAGDDAGGPALHTQSLAGHRPPGPGHFSLCASAPSARRPGPQRPPAFRRADRPIMALESSTGRLQCRSSAGGVTG